MIVSRRIIYLAVLLLLLVYSALFWNQMSEFRNFINAQYLKLKEFVLLLSEVERKGKINITERNLRELFGKYGLEVKEIRYEDGKYKIKVRRVPAPTIPHILKEIEKGGVVEVFEAVDNTGMGEFDLTITVKPS